MCKRACPNYVKISVIMTFGREGFEALTLSLAFKFAKALGATSFAHVMRLESEGGGGG